MLERPPLATEQKTSPERNLRQDCIRRDLSQITWLSKHVHHGEQQSLFPRCPNQSYRLDTITSDTQVAVVCTDTAYLDTQDGCP